MKSGKAMLVALALGGMVLSGPATASVKGKNIASFPFLVPYSLAVMRLLIRPRKVILPFTALILPTSSGGLQAI